MSDGVQAIPRLLIAGTQSGVGKSSITLALVAALRQRGLRVQTYKVGPDYLDPGHLAKVSGRPCYNLDSWMSDHDYLRDLLFRTGADADICLVEGVMGLFDGSSSVSLSGSSAEIAALLDIPVALVVNSHGMARSIAALVSGYNNFEDGVRLAGVIANRCGSKRHVELLQEALSAAGQPDLLGAIPRDGLPHLPSRHLGLVSAAEQELSAELVAQLAAAAEQSVDLDLLLTKARETAPLGRCGSSLPAADVSRTVRLGVARDAAFQFYYADLFNQLQARGCEAVFFSPLDDSCLPADLDGIYLGGGYPEVYAQQLAQNSMMLTAIRAFCASDKPVYAECGGLIYLTRGVELAGKRHPLVGEVPVWTRMLEKRKTLGYVTAELTADSLFGMVSTRFRGHEFHYSELMQDPIGCDGWQAGYQLTQNRGGQVRPEGYQRGKVLASYAHLHLASQPQALDFFIGQMREAKDRAHDKHV